MQFDYSKLNGRVVEMCGTQRRFSQLMGISEHSISTKLSGKQSWKQTEIRKACDILNIPKKDIHDYFFCVLSSEKLNSNI